MCKGGWGEMDRMVVGLVRCIGMVRDGKVGGMVSMVRRLVELRRDG